MNQDTFKKALDACVEYRKQLDEKTNEVAKLRELLNRAIEVATEYQKHACKNINEDCDWSMQGTHKKLDDLQDAIARLAPAPEEPVFIPTDLNQQNKENTHSLNDWRELGPDEVIQEGDQVQLKHHNRKGVWIKVWNHEIGATPEDQEAMRYRTRRPLPTTNHKCFSSKLVDETKKEEMPLEDEIEKSLKWIEGDGKYPLDHDEMFGEVCNCLRYLRDEIQKLKES